MNTRLAWMPAVVVAACHGSDPDPNNAPIAVDSTLQTNEDQLGSVSLAITDADNEPLTVTISRAPSKGIVTVSGLGPFVFEFTPTSNLNGADSFEYRVSDGRGGSDTATIAIVIAAVADPPTVEAATFELDEDGSRSARIVANDVDGDTLTLRLITAPVYGTAQFTNAGTGDFTYTPPGNFTGDEAFVVRASDGALDSASATIMMRVRPVNDAPLASPDNITVPATGDSTIDVLANDVDVDGESLTLELSSQPPGATVSVVANRISVTPLAGSGGPTEFSYRVRDAVGITSSATVRLVIGSFRPVYFMSDEQTPGEQRIYRYDYFSRRALETPLPPNSRLDGFATGRQGNHLVYISRTDIQGSPVKHRLWVKNVVDPNEPVTELPTDSTFFARTIAMSPNGHLIAYNNQWAKVTPPQQFGSIDGSVERAAFTRDSQTIFYTELEAGGGRRIKRKPATSTSFGTYVTAQYQIAQGLGMDFRLTPDETRVVSTGLFLHAGIPSGGPMQSAFVSPVDGTFNDQRLHPAYTMVDEYAYQPEVTADGRYAYYMATLAGANGIYATDLDAPGVAVRLDVNPGNVFASGPTVAADSRTLFYSLQQVGWFYTRIDQPGTRTPLAPAGFAALAVRAVTLAPDGSAVLFSSNFDTYVTSAPYATATLVHDDPGTIGVENIRYASDSNTAVIVGASGGTRRVLLVSPKIPGWVHELGSPTTGDGVRCVAFQGEVCRF
jgi:hypothetical protein